MKKNGMYFTIRADKITSEQRRKNTAVDQMEKMTCKGLIREYLCKGKRSACVRYGRCSVLEKCRYGQRYLELRKQQEEEK